MHFPTLTLLAFACKTALAVPTPSRAAELPLPARTIFQLNETVPDTWFENIALRQNGDLLVTMLQPSASIYSIQQPLSGSPKASIINIDNANGLLGIVETAPDVFAVVAGIFSAPAVRKYLVPLTTSRDLFREKRALAQREYHLELLLLILHVLAVNGTMAVWEVDLRGPEPTTRLITKMPEAGILNGVALVPGCSPPAILVADTAISRVWRVDITTGEYETAAEIPEMLPAPNATLPLGVNGVKTRGEYLYFSNSNLASIFRLPIDKRGVAARDAEAELVAKVDADIIDDFLIDEEGKYWVATNFQNTVVVAETGSSGVVVAGATTQLTVAGDTALALGRGTKEDKNIVYAVTGGTLNRPVNGTVSEPAKVVAIDRTGFK
ncbi:hypothetical protein EKO27_g11188 [Xylaria grammica]|uniref:SMP-30/Gluconolactonase/LRE-like region domain-containing protein n=1 Tax=Xylaria grammica TaxID=363999 RepID=A0A439CP54_9PEZI|nr:hypothetical protein EKO27_g11188 [Xylaria grammica]